MNLFPEFAEFEAGYEKSRPQVVWTTLVADLETPVSAYLKLAQGRANAFLFESVEGGATIGRYSFLGCKPDLIWRCFGERAEVNRQARYDTDSFKALDGEPLATLQELVEESRIDLPPGLPPMASCLVGYLGYDTVRLMERLPCTNPDPLALPDGLFMRPTVIAIFDRVEDKMTVVTPVWPGDGMTARAAYARACERLSDTVQDFERALAEPRTTVEHGASLPEPSSNMSPEDFKGMVGRAKEYILAGDIFQVVLSQRFSVPFSLPPFSLYRALRRLNPSPFLVYLDLGRRHGDHPADRRNPPAWRHARRGPGARRGPPERPQRAGRTSDAARPGAQRRRAGLRGRQRQSDRADGRRALQPRDAHRLQRRGPVARRSAVDGRPCRRVPGRHRLRGAQGAGHGDHRRARARPAGHLCRVQAGAGIVADSDPDSEHQECHNKARALVRAAEEAIDFALSHEN
jgi:anthranilate synthase component 1